MRLFDPAMLASKNSDDNTESTVNPVKFLIVDISFTSNLEIHLLKFLVLHDKFA